MSRMDENIRAELWYEMDKAIAKERERIKEEVRKERVMIKKEVRNEVHKTMAAWILPIVLSIVTSIIVTLVKLSIG